MALIPTFVVLAQQPSAWAPPTQGKAHTSSSVYSDSKDSAWNWAAPCALAAVAMMCKKKSMLARRPARVTRCSQQNAEQEVVGDGMMKMHIRLPRRGSALAAGLGLLAMISGKDEAHAELMIGGEGDMPEIAVLDDGKCEACSDNSCPKCAVRKGTAKFKMMGLSQEMIGNGWKYQPVGCPNCKASGRICDRCLANKKIEEKLEFGDCPNCKVGGRICERCLANKKRQENLEAGALAA